MFKPYFKTKDETSNKMNVGSHGIGLSFCKRVAKKLGGDLILNEAIRDGCEFELSLKLKKLDAPAKVTTIYLMSFSIKKVEQWLWQEVRQKAPAKVLHLSY